MKNAPIQDVVKILRQARQRLAVQDFLTSLVKLALLAGAVLIALGAVNRWVLLRLPVEERVTWMALAAVPVVALLAAVAQRKSLPRVATLLDRAGGTRDRFSTALAFADKEAPGEMQTMAVQECAAYARKGEFGRLTRLRFPGNAMWVLVPIVTLLLMQFEARMSFRKQAEQTAAAQAAVEDTAKKLEELARKTAQANEAEKSEDLKRLAEQLKRSAEQLRTNATSAEDASKSAMRELSALEQMVQELQKSPAATPEELRAVARALAESEATKEAAKALDAGDLAKAAEELEKALKNLAEQKQPEKLSEIEKAVADALKKLAQKQPLSPEMQKLAREMQRAQAEQGGMSEEAMKQLAQLLQQMQQQQGQQKQQNPGGKGEQKAMTLQQLLAALQNMKQGEGGEQSGEDSKPGDGEGSGQVTVQVFSKGGEAGPGDPQMPSGLPGSERDTGTTDTPFGKVQNDPGQNAQAKQISGRLGAGESLSQMLPSAGDNSKSNRRYKELYEAMAPAAADASEQENIPLGSRFFIKRYFESIRPKE